MSTIVRVDLSKPGVITSNDILKIIQVAQSIKYPIVSSTLHSDGSQIPYINLIADNNVSGDDEDEQQNPTILEVKDTDDDT